MRNKNFISLMNIGNITNTVNIMNRENRIHIMENRKMEVGNTSRLFLCLLSCAFVLTACGDGQGMQKVQKVQETQEIRSETEDTADTYAIFADKEVFSTRSKSGSDKGEQNDHALIENEGEVFVKEVETDGGANKYLPECGEERNDGLLPEDGGELSDGLAPMCGGVRSEGLTPECGGELTAVLPPKGGGVLTEELAPKCGGELTAKLTPMCGGELTAELAPECGTPSYDGRLLLRCGNTGASVELTNPDTIAYITNNLCALTYEKGSSSKNHVGWSYLLQWYDTENTLTASVVIMDAYTIDYQDYFYHGMEADNEIDIAFLAELLEDDQSRDISNHN